VDYFKLHEKSNKIETRNIDSINENRIPPYSYLVLIVLGVIILLISLIVGSYF